MEQRSDVFISYSHKDERWLRRLEVHLRPVVRGDHIKIWSDCEIQPGTKWRDEISKAINSARVGVLLVSADFLASDFIGADELPPLLKAADKSATVILPVIVGASVYEDQKVLSQFQPVNDPKKPLASMTKHKQEEVLVKLTKRIASLVGSVTYGVRQTQHPMLELPDQANALTEAALDVYPRDFLAIVVDRKHSGELIFNMDCRLVNKSAEPASLRRLEAVVTLAENLPLQLMWNLLYESSRGIMYKSADTDSTIVNPGEEREIGVQFVGPKLARKLFWAPGRYTVELMGWVKHQPRRRDVDLKTSFQIDITPQESDFLRYWLTAPDLEWDALYDPDDAVAIPVAIDPRTLKVGIARLDDAINETSGRFRNGSLKTRILD